MGGKDGEENKNRTSQSQDVQLKILASETHCFKHVTKSVNTVLLTWGCKANVVWLSGFMLMVLFDCRTLFNQPLHSMGPCGILGPPGTAQKGKLVTSLPPRRDHLGPHSQLAEHFYSSSGLYLFPITKLCFWITNQICKYLLRP